MNPLRLLFALLLLTAAGSLSAATVYHVDAAIAGSGDGLSWGNAKKTLKEALDIAGSGSEVWVKAGTYHPSTSDRAISFNIPSGVAVYGGFAGGESNRELRQPRVNITILSGDFSTIGTYTDNTYVIVRGKPGCTLDGFTIRDGYAYIGGDRGAGYHSGALAGTQTIRDCLFINNQASDRGGAIFVDYVTGMKLNVDRCSFISNRSGSSSGGGAIYAWGELEVTSSVFYDNRLTGTGGSGGAILFNLGGAIGKRQRVVNSTFYGNRSNNGAAIWTNETASTVELINNVFWNNLTFAGAATYQVLGTSSTSLTSCTYPSGASGVNGVDAGDIIGTSNTDPAFVNIGSPSGADGVYGTTDDGLALSAGSASANNGSLTDIPANDVTGRGRVRGTGVERGAYELPGVAFVDSGATPGNGSSWGSPYADLSLALAGARAGDEVWVKAGTYRPSATSDISATFLVQASVPLYGGFAGGESVRISRDWRRNQTILSGDLGNGYFSRHVLVARDLARIDGFTVRDGQATGNEPDNSGGGLLVSNASVTVANCIFANNSSSYVGGAIYSYGNSSVTTRESVFVGNVSSYGGAVCGQIGTGTDTFQNCVFIDNKAYSQGAVVWMNHSSAFTNCAVLRNTPGNATPALYLNSGTSTLSNSIIWGNYSAVDGGGSRSFKNCDVQGSGGSGAWTGLGTDNGGNLAVDYEPYDLANPAGLDGRWMTGDDGVRPRATSPAVNAGDNASATAADITGRARPAGVADIGAYESRGLIRVDQEVVGGLGNGTSWANAYASLATALSAAGSGDEVWVRATAAAYAPTTGINRSSTFAIQAGTVILGGFTTRAETSRNQRDWRANQTVLSGDIGGGLRAYNVVTGADGAVLDGFIIKRGQANGSFPGNAGGGLHLNQATMLVRNCVFTANSASYAGAVYATGPSSSPRFENCVFTGNTATAYGGVMDAEDDTTPVFANCTFSGNSGATGRVFASLGGSIACTNGIIFGNTGTTEVYGDCTFSYSLIEGSNGSGGAWDANYGTDAGGNIDGDPAFLNSGDAIGADGKWMTADDGLRLVGGSPAANTGTSSGMPAQDVLGQTRPIGGGYDMGAYEGRCPQVQFASATSEVDEGQTASLGLTLSGQADYSVTIPFSSGAGGTATDGVRIGTGTTGLILPFWTTNIKTRSQSLYLASELGGAATLRSLTLEVSSLPAATLSNFTIRLQHSALSSFTGGTNWLTAGWTQVYAGNLTVSSTGLLTVPFSTTFAYDGTSNLIVDLSYSNAASAGSNSTVNATPTGSNRTLYLTGSIAGDPLTWSSANGGNLTPHIPNIRLGRSATVANGGTAAGARADANAQGSVTIPAGNATWSIPLPAWTDAINEGNETQIVTLGAPVAGSGGGTRLGGTTSHTLTIKDADATPAVQFTTGSSTATEANSARSIGLSLSGKSDRVVSVNWTNEGGSATSGSDYSGLAGGTITFPAGETAQSISWSMLDDDFDENDESVQLKLSGPGFAILGTTTLHTAYISDDSDAAGVEFDTTVLNALGEHPGSQTGQFQVRLKSRPLPGSTITLTFSSSDTDQATVSPASISFTSAAGSWNTLVPVTVTAVDDSFADGTASPTIGTVVSVSGTADAKYANVTPSIVTTTIADNDVAGLSVGYPLLTTSASAVTSGNPTSQVQLTAGTLATAQAWLAAGRSMVLAFHGVLAKDGGRPNGGEYPVTAINNATGVVTVTGVLNSTASAQPVRLMLRVSGPVLEAGIAATASGVNAGTRVVALSGNPNLSRVAAGMLLTFTGSSPNAGSYLVESADDSANTVTLVDPVPAGFAAVTSTILSQGVTIGGSALTYARTTSQPTQPVSLGFGTSDLSAGTPDTDTIAIPNDVTWPNLRALSISPVNDARADGNQSWTLKVLASTSSDSAYAGIDLSDIAMITVDDESKGVLYSPVSPSLAVTEGGATASYTICLTSEPTADVTVTLSSSNSQCSISPTPLTFTVSTWMTPQTVTVTAINDDLIEAAGSQNGNILHAIASAGDYSSGVSAANVPVTVTDNDSPGFLVAGVMAPSAASLSVPESGVSTISYRLTAIPASNVTVDLTLGAAGVSNGVTITCPSATVLTVGQVLRLTFTPAGWNTAQIVSVNAPVDNGNSVNETYAVTGGNVTGPTGFPGLGVAQVNCTNIDDDVAGFTLVQSGGTTAVSEGGSGDTYDIKLNTTPVAGNFIQVQLAFDASQITVTPSTLLWTSTNWGQVKTIAVAAVNDSIAEGGHNTAISIQTADVLTNDTTVGNGGYLPANNPSLSRPALGVTIADNDSAGVIVSPTSGLTVTETGGVASFFIRLSSQPSADGTVTVPISLGGANPGAASISTNGGASFASSGNVLFTTSGAGTVSDWNVPHEVQVRGENDFLAGGARSFTVVTGTTSSTAGGYVGFDPADVTGATIDNDTVGVIISTTSLSLTEAAGASHSATYNIRLACQPSAASVTININGGSQVTVPASLTFTNALGDWNVDRPVTVTAVADSIDETSPHTASITHTAVGGDFTGVAIQSVTASITDEPSDVVGFSMSAASALLLERPLTVTVDSVAGTTATLLGGPDLALLQPGMVLTFTGASPNAGSYLITAIGAGSVTLGASVPAAGTALVVGGTDQGALIGAAVPIDLHLASKPLGTVSIGLASTDGTAATATPATLNFSPSNWDSPQSFLISAMDDPRDLPNRTPTVITTVTATDPAYNGLALADLPITVVDDDRADLVITLPSGGLQTTEAGGATAFSIALATQPSADVVVPLTVNLAAQGQVDPVSLTFTATNWATPQTVTVAGLDDDGVDNGVSGTAYRVNIGLPVSSDGAYTTAFPFSAALDARDPAVTNLRSNAAPLCDQPADQTITEDTNPAVITLTGIDSGQSGEIQALTITATSNNPSLIPNPPVSGAGATRTLDLTPLANTNGSATITVTVIDDASVDGTARSLQRSFTVNVTPVDDAPTLALNGGGAAFLEGDPAVAVAPNLTVGDIDSASLAGATAVLSPAPDGTNEVLSASGSGIATAWDSATSTLTLSGAQPPAAYMAALRSLAYRNLSDDPGTSNRTITITVNDGTSASSSAVATVTVAKRNNAPQVAGAASLTAIAEEETANTGTAVAALAAQFTITDADAADATHRGLAIIGGDSSHGVWQFTVNNGGLWTTMSPSTSAAVLLRGGAGQAVRFQPAQDFNGTATLTVRAWDWSTGTDGATNADTALNGARTAFSAATATCTVIVSPVNDAPSISGTALLTAIAEDTLPGANLGTSISSLIPMLGISDPDAGDPVGVAVVTADNSNGTWQYSLDSGGQWDAIAPVAVGNALLLPNAVSAMVRFLPNGSFNGTAQLTVRAWDVSAGTNGAKIDAASGTSCSTMSGYLQITVTPVNDAPTASTLIGLALNTITENLPDGSNPGTPVAALIDGLATDIDVGASQGIAVTGKTGSGIWQFRTSTSGMWDSIDIGGAVADNHALLLTDNGTVSLRYSPGLNEVGTRTISFRIWDRTSGSNGAYGDASANGGTTAFSVETLTSSILVNASATAPVITLSGPALTTDEEAAATTIDANPMTEVTDLDSAVFDSGYLTVSFASPHAGDIIAVPGTTPGTFLVGGDAVVVGGATVGTVDTSNDGRNAHPLTITFTNTGAATRARLTSLLKSLTFRTASDTPPAGARNLSFVINDGGLTSVIVNKSVTITAFDDPPRITTPTHPLVLVPGVQHPAVQLQASDPEGLPLTFSLDPAYPASQGEVNGMPNATGVFTYRAFATASTATDSFRIVVSDGVNSPHYDYPVRISLAGSGNPIIVSPPLLSIFQNDPLQVYTPTVINGSGNLRFYLIDAPAGVSCGVGNGAITWPAAARSTAPAGDYYLFGLLVIDDDTDRAGYLPFSVHWMPGSSG